MQRKMFINIAGCRKNQTIQKLKNSCFACTIGTYQAQSGLRMDTEADIVKKVVFFLAAVREGDLAERDKRRG